jgi:hypothetical protein
MQNETIFSQFTRADLLAGFREIVKEEIKTLRDADESKIQYLTVPDIQRMFKIGKQSVYNWINSGHLIRHKVGGRTFFLKSEVESAAAKKYQHS